jgi:hypothetical protein
MSVRIGLVLTVLVVVGGLSIWLVQRNDQAELAQQYNLEPIRKVQRPER